MGPRGIPGGVVTWSNTAGQYWDGPPVREVHRIRTSRTEVLHLSIAFVVLTVDFVILQNYLNPGSLFLHPEASTPWATYAILGGAAAFTGFLAHELAHKVVAERHGLWAEFRASWAGLALSFVTANFGFLFAAPGATVVDGMGDLAEWGRISIAGPIVNLVAGVGFLGGFWLVAPQVAAHPGYATLASGLGFLAFINSWFATFNLIPFGPLDGRKVWRWNKLLWVTTIAAGGLLTVAAFLGAY